MTGWDSADDPSPKPLHLHNGHARLPCGSIPDLRGYAVKIRCLYDRLAEVTDLVPHPKNRNQHPDDQIARLAKILEYQGWRYPIKVSAASGYITSGHGRLLAAQNLGWNQVPVNVQEYETEEQEMADLTADNAIASWAELDLSGINTDLGDLGPDFDIEMLGLKNFTVDVAELPDLPTGDKSPFQQKTFLVSDDQADQVERALALAKSMGAFTDTGNENSNGNALARVCELFVTSHGDS